MRFKKERLFAAAVVIVSLVGFARADLTKRINGIISRPSQKKVKFSVHIVEGDSGRAVYGRDAHSAMVPASNMKIVITAAALKYLGANFEYKTAVGLCGDTLAVIGGGDPLLGDKDTDARYSRKGGWIFEDIAAALKNNGITEIKDIIVDSSIYDDQRVHPNWPKEQLNRSYACEVSGLNFNGNCIDITAKNTGGRVAVLVEPETDFVNIKNEVVPTKKGKSAVGSYRLREANRIIVFGKCKSKDGPFAVAIERPAAFFGFLLAENLARSGINTSGQLIERPIGEDCDFKLLTEYSTSMADCLRRCNEDSFGLAAEALVKTIAAVNKPGGKNGGWAQGREAIHNYLLGLGIDESEFYVDDGSGLSRENRLSANAITRVLLGTYKSKDWQLYKNSLAIAGVEGTLKKYFSDKKYKGKIFGKTGYIGGVKSFSGICKAGDGDFIFSILANGANGKTRKAINDIAKAIIDKEN